MREAKYIKPISIALSPEMYDTVKAITDEKKISMSEWFRAAAEEKLNENAQRQD
jgi:metal-responsive CopG/Arc/MetJ family transcriptional regulator